MLRMLRRQVPLDDLLPSLSRRGVFGSGKEPSSKVGHPLCNGLYEKIIFAAEVLIKAAHCQTRGFHQSRNTRAVQSPSADLTGSVSHDPLTSLRFVIRFVTHV